MPNFGRIGQDLIGGSLRINDTLVIDQDLNLVVGNVSSTTIIGPIYTGSITEQQSMQGIKVYGNISVEQGWNLTGQITASELVVVGGASCEQALTVNGVINAGMLTTATIIVDSIMTRTEPEISIVGNLIMLDPDTFISGNLQTSIIEPQTPGGTISINGCISVLKSEASLVVPNVYSSDTPAGTILLSSVTIAPGGLNVIPVQLQNSCIKTDSLIFVTIGKFLGLGLPYIELKVTNPGIARFDVINIGSVPTTDVIPIQYLIV